MYSLTTLAAYVVSSNVPSTPPKTLGDTGALQLTLVSKPGFKPLTEGTKGAYVSGASAICRTTLTMKGWSQRRSTLKIYLMKKEN